MKSYSIDLRQKVIDAYEAKEDSQRRLAKRFKIWYSSVQRWLKQYYVGEGIAPKPHGGGQSAKLSASQLEPVKAIIEGNNDATLFELCERVDEKLQVTVSRSTMGRITQQLGFSQKKTLHASERYTERVQKLRMEYWQIIGEVKFREFNLYWRSGCEYRNDAPLCPVWEGETGLW